MQNADRLVLAINLLSSGVLSYKDKTDLQIIKKTKDAIKQTLEKMKVQLAIDIQTDSAINIGDYINFSKSLLSSGVLNADDAELIKIVKDIILICVGSKQFLNECESDY